MQHRAGGLQRAGGANSFEVLSTLAIEGGSSSELSPEQHPGFVLKETIWFTPKPIPVVTTINETWVIREHKLVSVWKKLRFLTV